MDFFLLLCIDMFTVHMDPKVVSSSPGTGIQKKKIFFIFSHFVSFLSTFRSYKFV